MSEVQHLILSVGERASGSTRRPGLATAGHDGHPAGTMTLSGATAGTGVPASVPTRVYVYAKDPILRAGIATQLRRSPMVSLVDTCELDPEGVAVIIADDLRDDVITAIVGIRRSCTPRIVAVANRLTPSSAAGAHEAGAWRFLRRADARADQLVAAVRDVAGQPARPAILAETLGMLVDELDEDDPVAPPRPAGLTDRDVDVLRLMADGQSTAGIARDLAYSESTIKNIIHAIVHELGARNRAHAVAMAVRSQLI